MERLAALFEPRAEVIADYKKIHGRPEFAARREDVLALLRRRPCTIRDIANGLGLHRNEAAKYLEELMSAGAIGTEAASGGLYYKTQSAQERSG
jgi:predicted ArsR family transcriptional regulator